MAAAPARFTFDLDLGHREERNAVIPESAMSAMLQQARSEGMAQGFAEGEKSALAQSARQLTAAAEGLAGKVAAMTAALDDTRKANLAEAVGLSAVIAKKLAGALLEREPIAEIEALIVDCFAALNAVPHVVIRCHIELADAVRDLAMARIAHSGFAGRLVVLGDPEVAPGDARVEWADGGVVRDMALLTAEIDQRIATFLAPRGIHPPIEETIS